MEEAKVRFSGFSISLEHHRGTFVLYGSLRAFQFFLANNSDQYSLLDLCDFVLGSLSSNLFHLTVKQQAA